MGPVEALRMAMAKEIDSKIRIPSCFPAHPSLKDTFIFSLMKKKSICALLNKRLLS